MGFDFWKILIEN